MASVAPEPSPSTDDSGVDREQIREMLKLTPEERLRRVEQFVESLLEIRELLSESAAPAARYRPASASSR